MTATNYFELPLNERMRTFLRLEFLFGQCQHFLSHDNVFDTRVAVSTLLDIYNILGMSDLKKEAMKELERHHTALAPLQSSPGVDIVRLNEVLDNITRLNTTLSQSSDHFGQELKSNDFLTNVLQRLAIPGGTCNFDMPAFHFWLSQPLEYRITCMHEWLKKLQVIQDTTELTLGLTRQSSGPQPQVAEQGFFQYNLAKESPCQLIRVAIPQSAPYFAEISGSKHRIAVRFLELSHPSERPTQITQNIEFDLYCCRI